MFSTPYYSFNILFYCAYFLVCVFSFFFINFLFVLFKFSFSPIVFLLCPVFALYTTTIQYNWSSTWVACSERSASIASVGNSSLGAHSTVTIGNSVAAGSTAADSYHGSATLNARDSVSQHDYPSLTLFDDFPLEVLQEYETATSYGKILIFYNFVNN